MIEDFEEQMKKRAERRIKEHKAFANLISELVLYVSSVYDFENKKFCCDYISSTETVKSLGKPKVSAKLSANDSRTAKIVLDYSPINNWSDFNDLIAGRISGINYMFPKYNFDTINEILKKKGIFIENVRENVLVVTFDAKLTTKKHGKKYIIEDFEEQMKERTERRIKEHKAFANLISELVLYISSVYDFENKKFCCDYISSTETVKSLGEPKVSAKLSANDSRTAKIVLDYSPINNWSDFNDLIAGRISGINYMFPKYNLDTVNEILKKRRIFIENVRENVLVVTFDAKEIFKIIKKYNDNYDFEKRHNK